MPLIIHPDSHLDHGLTEAHLELIRYAFADREGFFISTVELPPELPSLECALYGPIMGDSTITEDMVHYRVRGNRKHASRMVDLPMRPTRKLTVIAGPHDGQPCVLYTAFGGPITPKEPGDRSMQTDEFEQARAFWSAHALAR